MTPVKHRSTLTGLKCPYLQSPPSSEYKKITSLFILIFTDQQTHRGLHSWTCAVCNWELIPGHLILHPLALLPAARSQSPSFILVLRPAVVLFLSSPVIGLFIDLLLLLLRPLEAIVDQVLLPRTVPQQDGSITGLPALAWKCRVVVGPLRLFVTLRSCQSRRWDARSDRARAQRRQRTH